MRRITLLGILCLLFILPAPGSAQDLGIIPVVGPDNYPPGVNPLTGLTVANPENLARRPINIKISNFPAVVRPQSGLSRADIVWEHVMEGGVTRFAAIFLGEDVDHLGPVRSARLVDFEITRIYDALVVYSGASQGTLERLRNDSFMLSRSVTNQGCPPLCRFPSPGKAFEHTLYGETQGLYQQASRSRRASEPNPLHGMAFSEIAPAGGMGLQGVDIAYRNASTQWAYDPISGRWLRSQSGEPHFDALTGSQLSAANVLIIEADHFVQSSPYDGYWGPGNFAFTVDLTGTGRAFLLRDGQLLRGQWQRDRRDQPLSFVGEAGNLLTFKPGNTFVNLMPRWTDGFQLNFLLSSPPNASVTTGSIALRSGPGNAYRVVGRAEIAENLPVIGRNGVGDWLQILLPGDEAAWLPASVVNIGGFDIERLPRSRSSSER